MFNPRFMRDLGRTRQQQFLEDANLRCSLRMYKESRLGVRDQILARLYNLLGIGQHSRRSAPYGHSACSPHHSVAACCASAPKESCR